jgi:pimeloyl-ACP methyl ester carboxylesterase
VYASLCVRADRVRTSTVATGGTDGGRVRRLGWWVVTLLLGVVAVLYVCICGYMALTLTRPERHPFSHFPEQFGLAYESVEFPSRTDRIQLRGWLLAPDAGAGQRSRPVIMVHGKGADREAGPGEGILGVAAPLARDGYRVLTFDLRGSGQSGGDRFTLGAQEVRDVGGAIDFLHERGLAADGVNLVGFSMGGATVLLTAADDKAVRAVAEDSGYADLGELIDVQVPRLSGLPSFFTPGMVLAVRDLIGVDLYTIRPSDAMPQLARADVPVLIIHGEADTYVPPINARRLAAAYGPGAETLFIPGAGHVEGHVVAPTTYDERLRSFLDRSARR